MAPDLKKSSNQDLLNFNDATQQLPSQLLSTDKF